MRLYHLLQALEKLEAEMAVLYKGFQEQFAGDIEAGAVFKQLHKDEIEHKNIVSYLLRLVLNNPKEFCDLDQDAGKILEMVAKVKKIDQERRMIELKEAVLWAVKLESCATEQHFRTAALNANPQLSEMCKNLGKADESHLFALKALAKSKKISVTTEGNQTAGQGI